jgi:signal transduction histidine kinase
VDPLLRARLAIAVAGVALIGGILALVTWRVDFGLTFAVDGDTARIASVGAHSPAELEKFRPGMVVLAMNGVQLVKTPEYVYATPGPNGEEPPGDPIGIEPTVATPVDLPPGQLEAIVIGGTSIRDLQAIDPARLQELDPGGGLSWTFIGRDYQSELERTIFAYIGGAAFLVVASWWLLQGRGGASLQGLAFPLATAASVPLLVQPLAATWAAPALALAGILVPLAMVPLGLALLERVPEAPSRLPIRVAVVACAVGATAIGVFRVWLPASAGSADIMWFVLSAAIPLIPGIAAAAPAISAEARGATGGGVVQSAELAVAGATPAMALMTGGTPWNLLFPLSAWLFVVLFAGRFTIRPLARVAMRAALQRDLIVAATEAERARVAADIHDDALQELTLLVQRLDDAGDAEGADIARTVSDRLRAICGDLRLPILDDLGVGPALDWLATRIERLAGGEVRLERSDASRLPADVELGIFRVAQEALANAVKHGKPPITVRYRSSKTGASLSIDDAGPGIAPDAASKAELDGRFGLLNMQQRAEQIGAILDIRRWPSGGTHVALEWRAR